MFTQGIMLRNHLMARRQQLMGAVAEVTPWAVSTPSLGLMEGEQERSSSPVTRTHKGGKCWSPRWGWGLGKHTGLPACDGSELMTASLLNFVIFHGFSLITKLVLFITIHLKEKNTVKKINMTCWLSAWGRGGRGS